LEGANDGKSCRLIWTDDTGWVWYFDGLGPGKYLLRFEYENTREKFWIGKAATNGVKFEIVAPENRGASPEARPIEELIALLTSADGAVRVAATKEIFRRGRGTLQDLQRAGARQVALDPGAAPKRSQMVYSLLAGLPPNPTPDSGYKTGSFG